MATTSTCWLNKKDGPPKDQKYLHAFCAVWRERRLYFCQLCRKQYKSLAWFKKHLKAVHSREPFFKDEAKERYSSTPQPESIQTTVAEKDCGWWAESKETQKRKNAALAEELAYQRWKVKHIGEADPEIVE